MFHSLKCLARTGLSHHILIFYTCYFFTEAVSLFEDICPLLKPVTPSLECLNDILFMTDNVSLSQQAVPKLLRIKYKVIFMVYLCVFLTRRLFGHLPHHAGHKALLTNFTHIESLLNNNRSECKRYPPRNVISYMAIFHRK